MDIPLTNYPPAIDPRRVGKYDTLAGSGGGYFWDAVLEYRVWVHPFIPGIGLGANGDYCRCFSTFEVAQACALATLGAEPPCVLILQEQYIDEPSPGVYTHMTEPRITEWDVEFLAGSKREPHTILAFLASPEAWLAARRA